MMLLTRLYNLLKYQDSMVKLYKKYLYTLFFTRRFFAALAVVILLFVISYAVPLLLPVAKLLLAFGCLLTVFDYGLLFLSKSVVSAKRQMADRFSNGDENKVSLLLENDYRFAVQITIIDEVPDQFQRRNFSMATHMIAGALQTLDYFLEPTERGEYIFHNINILVKSPLQLLQRRIIIPAQQTIKVYPSFLFLKQYELLAHSNNLAEAGNRKIRKLGQSLEFEQIKEYVTGDDLRNIN
jgi:uncharacterized protein (DUF58 family)